MENQFSQQLLIKYIYYIVHNSEFREGLHFVRTYLNPFLSIAHRKHKEQKLGRDTVNALALQEAINAGVVPIDIINDITEFSIRNL